MSKKQWIDENGMVIPASRVTKSEKLREVKLATLLRKAKEINKKLADFKDEFAASADEIFLAVMAENGIDGSDRKGNFLIKNFDGSIRAEVDVQERIEFDDALIAVAKEHFDTFLSVNIGSVDQMIRELIMDAFNNSGGRLDAKKITSLLKYRSRIDRAKYPSFHLAVDAIEKSISRPTSKRYFRISERSGEDGYTTINLNFSSI